VTVKLAGTPHIRLSWDGGRTFPARHARPLPVDPPGDQPCTIPVFDPRPATGRMLALDLDVSRGDVDHQAAELGQLLERLGARYLADVSMRGGRHIFVPFAAALPWLELRDLCRAVALRFAAVDTAPMSSMSAQISPPGSRHKSGGWRLLSTPLSEARAAVEHPNGPDVWSALLAEFAAELQQVERPAEQGADKHPAAELDDNGIPWVPRLGGRAPLGAELDQMARTGRWDRSRYPGRSEARMAVLAAAAARGWRLADVLEAVRSGAWKGFPGLYHRASEPGRMDRLLPAEWKKSVTFAGGEGSIRIWLTSDVKSRPPAPIDGADEFGLIRQWVTGTACAVADSERVRGWGRRAIAVRQLLAAIGQACMVSGSTVLEFGTRNLSLYSGLSQRTVSRLLAMLYSEDDPLLDVVTRGRMARADRFTLRIPDKYADSVVWRRRRAGRIDAIHPAFLVLGGTAALVYQVLDGAEASGAEVARAVRLSASATSAALRVLAEHGLAEHRPRGDGWLSLDDESEAEWQAMLFGRWPVLGDDFVRGPPNAARETAQGA
jgi:DNA-binding transcriptional ArsR family regulator